MLQLRYRPGGAEPKGREVFLDYMEQVSKSDSRRLDARD